MRADERISRLESLLDRVRRKAAEPRLSHAAFAAAIDGDGGAALAVAEPEEEPLSAEASEAFAEVEVEELELSEEEIVDLTEAEEVSEDIAVEIPPMPAAAAAAASEEMGLDWEEVEEHPASSRRPIAAASMDEALAGATDRIEMDEGREIPLKTPPPESGPQAAPPPQQALSAPPIPAEAQALSPPEVILDFEEPVQAPAFPSAPPMEVSESDLEPMELAPESGEVAPDVVRRPEVRAAAPSAYVAAVRGFSPNTFVELLDASLSLGE